MEPIGVYTCLGSARELVLEGVVLAVVVVDGVAPFVLFLLPDAPCIALDCGLLVVLLVGTMVFGDLVTPLDVLDVLFEATLGVAVEAVPVLFLRLFT